MYTSRITKIFSLFILLAASQSAYAADAPTPPDIKTQKILPNGDLVLNDGRTLHLRGIRLPVTHGTKDIVAALTKLTADKALQLSDVEADRYGLTEADVTLPDKSSLQEHLLDDGMAFVLPVTGTEPHLTQYLQHETSARTGRRGIWADDVYADASGDDAKDKIGSYAFVRFKVLEAAKVKTMVYLNARANHHEDFTVAIRSTDLRAFRNAGIDPLTYQGKIIRVRGWVVKRGGALINVTTPAQIEILD